MLKALDVERFKQFKNTFKTANGLQSRQSAQLFVGGNKGIIVYTVLR